MTKDLIKVTVKNDTQLVSARDLHKGLEIKKRFSKWVEQNFKDFIEGEDYTSVPKGTVVKSGNGTERKYDDYALTISMAKELAMVSHSDKGREYRKYFLQLEKDWNNPAKVIERGYHYLQDENYTLKIENTNLNQENSQLKTDNQLMAPKAKYFDDIVDSKTLTSFTDTAHEFGIKPREFTKWLRDNNFIYYDKKQTLRPYEEFKGTYFVVKDTRAGYPQTKVTPQGREALHLMYEASLDLV